MEAYTYLAFIQFADKQECLTGPEYDRVRNKK